MHLQPPQYCRTVLQNGSGKAPRALLKKRSFINEPDKAPRELLKKRSLINGPDKAPRALLKKRSLIKYSPVLLKDNKHLRAALGTERRCFSRENLDWECIVRDLDSLMCYSHSIPFRKVAQLTKLAEVTVQGLCNCNSV